MGCDTTGPNPEDDDDDDRKPPALVDDDDRKPPAPDDSDEDCFTIKLAWEDHIRISAVELWHRHLNPTFAVKDNLYTQLNHGSRISCFPDPNAFYILRRQTIHLWLTIETNTDNYLNVEGVGHVGAIRRSLWTPTQRMAILSPTHYLQYYPKTAFVLHEDMSYIVQLSEVAHSSRGLLRRLGNEGTVIASFTYIGGNFV